MTEWYDPRLLLKTAGKTFLSETIGEYADPRLGTADPRPGRFFDYSKGLRRTEFDFETIRNEERTDMWIDYVADVGDGWNPTYAVAMSLARPEIKIDGISEPLERGEMLFFGGDGVYPAATESEYEDRLVTPYRMAFKASGTIADVERLDVVNLKKEPHVFALPGNHDWYDSLVSFRDLFCSHIFNERRFAGAWRTRQKRSYFALKLPHNWWLLAVDMQLSHNIDVSQLHYFESIVEKMQAGDRVILCVPEPFWVKAIKYHKLTDKFEEKEKSIERLEALFATHKVEVKVYIAGDLHHYRRFEDENGVQKITAGGGGAFLHPTHDFDFRENKSDSIEELSLKQEKAKGFSLKADYPEFDKSKKLDKRNLWFIWNNKTFGIFTAILYALVGWLIFGLINYNFDRDAIIATANTLIATPSAIFILAVLFAAVIFFTDSNDKNFKRFAGFLHGVVHFTAILFLGWLVFLLTSYLQRNYSIGFEKYQDIIWFFCAISIAAVGGYFFGSIIMGLYLFVSLHFFGRHDNEAFSALKVEDYKNFLRLHIDENKNLTIYPLKIERVPRNWNPFPKGETDERKIEYYTPETKIKVELIEEKPIVIKSISETKKEDNQNVR